MKWLKNTSFLIAIFAMTTAALFADTSNNYANQISDLLDTVDQKDLWAVREWLRTKRVSLNNKLGELSLSGDVKAEWRYAQQSLGSQVMIGGTDAPSGWPHNMYTIDFRMYLDYKSDKTWASIKLEFDEAAGLFGGQANNLALNRANMGYHLYDDGDMRFDILVGRQRAYEIYQSQLQFNSTFDGFTSVFAVGLEGLADFSFHGGGYIFNAVQNQPVWVLQAGLYDLLDTGFYFEYAFTNWTTSTANELVENDNSGVDTYLGNAAWAYRINQFILGYAFNPDVFGIDVRLFSGLLWNSAAQANAIQRISVQNKVHKKLNMGGWVTLQVGSVQKAGDWAFQAQWQLAQPYAVPDWDMAGIGQGNATSSGIWGPYTFSKATNFPGNGNSNFNSWEMDLLYSVTNELVLEARLRRSLSSTQSVGLSDNYTDFRLAAIYGF